MRPNRLQRNLCHAPFPQPGRLCQRTAVDQPNKPSLTPVRSPRLLLGASAATAALSAVLLMSAQPLWSRLSLPQAGGAPSVWTVSLAAFQALLLLGYALADRLARLAPRLRQVAHVGVLLAALTLQPLQIAANQPMDDPASLLGALLVALGVPFVGLSLSNTLLQLHIRDQLPQTDPYPLYAASNAGSLVGLLLQPFVADRLWGVQTQTWLWAAGLGVLTAMVIGLYATAPRPVWTQDGQEAPALAEAAGDPNSTSMQWISIKWLVWSLLPAALLTALSTWLSTAVAAVPMLWVLPLGLYLLTFVVVFHPRRPNQVVLERAAVLLATPVLLLLATGANHPVELVVGLHLLGFFAVSAACHGRLSAARPPSALLGRYWLLQAAGGALGGSLAALVFPLVFVGAEEYPLLVGATLAAGVAERPAALRRLWPWLAAGGAVLAGGVAGLLLTGPAGLLVRAVAAVGCFALSRQRLVYATVSALLLGLTLIPAADAPRPLAAERSFFGVHRVVEQPGGVRELFHGVTMHGRLDPRQPACTPLLYYTHSGPIGQLILERGLPQNAHVGAVGLGIGSLACYAQPSQSWLFFEIDAAVEQLARGAFGFPWGRPASVVLGDARRTLAESQPPFDLLVLDAYSADAIPLHLLTTEALDLYVQRLRPGGVLAFHISNRYFDLAPVLTAWAKARGLVLRLRDDAVVLTGEQADGKTESRWVAVARQAADLGPLSTDRRWTTPTATLDQPWTDDRASALDVWQAWNGIDQAQCADCAK